MRGSKASLIIKQGKEENYKPTLYIEQRDNDPAFEEKLKSSLENINKQFPGIALMKNNAGWQIIVPEKYNDGHEAHFAQVMKKYIEYLNQKNMPDWEIPNMLSKYYITTQAKALANKK
jgi:hypothetical protein